MKSPRLTQFLPDWKNAALSVLSAVLLILAFPDFEFWFLAWIGLVPFLWAIEREKGSAVSSFLLGWLWGLVFFTGTCWWLTFAPITYAAFPWPLAYFLLLCLTSIVAIFPGLFALTFSVLLQRVGHLAYLGAPSVWVLSEFLRYWLTGNNWNAIGYSQAFADIFLFSAAYGGVAIVSFIVVALNTALLSAFVVLRAKHAPRRNSVLLVSVFVAAVLLYCLAELIPQAAPEINRGGPIIVAIQPNVPMSGLTYEKWQQLRAKHVQLAESALTQIKQDPQSAGSPPPGGGVAEALRGRGGGSNPQSTVIFPESPMNFAYEEDEEFRRFVHAFAAKHDVQVLFNSAEPDGADNKYFNSAVLVGPEGKEIAQYDKIYLVPFGESVPAPLQSIVPAFVGSFSYGKEYDLLPLGEARAGVMICFESHFGELGREYVRNGADVIIEMTNDGYLGPTPVLRQHLANAVFRAVETGRPVLRITNVGITAYIDPRGRVLEASEPYTEATRVWPVAKSDGSQTFYVQYGDWFAWLCSVVTIGLLALAFWRKRPQAVLSA